jgi:predicted  nucleic acid-binding Zn-ribbon protein
MYRNQILLKRSTILPLSKDDNRKVELVVKRYLKLRQAPRSSSDHPPEETPEASSSYGRAGASNGYYASPSEAGAADISQLHAEIEAQRGDIDRIDSEGYKVVTALNDAVTRVEAGLGKMEATLAELRRDISGSHDDTASLKTEIKDVKKQSQVGVAENRKIIDRLEGQLKSANKTIEVLRHELSELTAKFDKEFAILKAGLRQNTKEITELKSSVKDRVSVREYAKDMAAVRGELAQLRKQMEDNRARPAGPFPSRELDILTSNISKIGNRANQVESLQMEFEIFKGRVERIEAAAQASSQTHQASVPHTHTNNTSAYDRYDDHDIPPEETRPSRRKRPSPVPDTSPVTRQKRTAISSDAGDAPSSPRPHLIETRGKKDVTGAKATKGAKVTKRTQRPQRKSLAGTNTEDKPHVKRRG